MKNVTHTCTGKEGAALEATSFYYADNFQTYLHTLEYGHKLKKPEKKLPAKGVCRRYNLPISVDEVTYDIIVSIVERTQKRFDKKGIEYKKISVSDVVRWLNLEYVRGQNGY